MFCAEDSALQFSWPVGRQAVRQARQGCVGKGFLEAVVVSDASAALVSIVLQTLTSLVSGGSRAAAMYVESSSSSSGRRATSSYAPR